MKARTLSSIAEARAGVRDCGSLDTPCGEPQPANARTARRRARGEVHMSRPFTGKSRGVRFPGHLSHNSVPSILTESRAARALSPFYECIGETASPTFFLPIALSF